jgi:hypothetical protein
MNIVDETNQDSTPYILQNSNKKKKKKKKKKKNTKKKKKKKKHTHTHTLLSTYAIVSMIWGKCGILGNMLISKVHLLIHSPSRPIVRPSIENSREHIWDHKI